MSTRDYLLAGAVLCAALAPRAPTQDAEKAAAAETAPASETIDSIRKDFSAAREKWSNEYRKATAEQKRTLMQSYPRPDAWRRRMWKLIKPAPHTAAAGEGLIWIVQNGASKKELKKALGFLREHHVGHEKVGDACSRLIYNIDSETESFLRSVRQKGSDKAKGAATYSLAKVLHRRASSARRIAADEKMRKSYASYYGDEVVEMLGAAEPDKLEKEAEHLLEICMQEHADTQVQGRPLAKRAEADLFEIRNLSIGKVAPDIEGEDVEGVAFKLSDYRGKVVMLDFWGDW